MAVRGRFDWDKLADYARKHNGKCDGPQCSLPGVTAGRTTSFYMLRSDVLALASASAATAGDMIGPGTWKEPPEIPAAALWVSAPPYVFTNPTNFPEGSRAFLSPLARARSTYFTLGAGSEDNFQLRMEVTTDTAQAASDMATQLSDMTDLLNKMLQRDNLQANPADLSGMLVAGKFEASGTKVTATWPIRRALIESFASQPVSE
jgi:hypothetical protein